MRPGAEGSERLQIFEQIPQLIFIPLGTSIRPGIVVAAVRVAPH